MSAVWLSSTKTTFAFSKFLMLFWANLPAHASQDDIYTELLENIRAAKFFHERNSAFHRSEHIEKIQSKLEGLGARKLQNPVYKIAAWLRELDGAYLRHQDNPSEFKKFKNYFYNEHLIKEKEIPQRYLILIFKSKLLAREDMGISLLMSK
jgi:hypothetical protein